MPVSAAKDRTLELFVLGPFRVVVDSQEVDERRLARRKPKLLVKLLALSPHRQMHRDELQDVLWPDLDVDAAANQLHKVIYQARRMLEPALVSASDSRFLGTQDRMVLLRAPEGVWVDAEEFSRLAAAAVDGRDPRAYEAALALYGGELLVEDPYEDCFALRREQLRTTHRDLLARLALLYETGGEPARAIDLLRGLVALDPWNEEVHRTLMRLYLASGSRSHALAQFEQCREALRRELDVEPDAETLAVRDRIVSGELEPTTAVAPDARPPNNLPRHLTSFVGRAPSVVEAERLLASGRLLTLAGPGGIGKTRLAFRLAEAALAGFPDGVWVVDLAPLADPALVPDAVAAVLGVRFGATDTVVAALAESLAARRMLLVLDNCEHLVAACSALVAALLRDCPDLRVLATSREPLGLFGEAVYRVAPMGAPDPRKEPPADQLPHYESVRLFLDRVQLHDPSFEITAKNARAVAEICHRLDGIPLAIELAAARMRALAIDTIVARLETCFRLLSGGDRAALPRQQTMRSAVDWSYALLTTEERALLRRLAIFAGSAPFDAIEGVCSDAEVPAGDVLDLLTRLVDKSLVTAERGGDDVRYRLLEPIRQYAFEQLASAGESERLLDAHAAWFVRLAERAESELFGPEQGVWFARLDVEHDNLRAVLRRTIDLGGRDDALRICAALGQFWDVRGYFAEGRMWIEAALAAAPSAPSAVRAKAINVAGSLAILQGDFGLAAECYERSLALRRASGEKGPLARTLHSLAFVVKCLGDTERALELQRESLALFQEVDDRLGIALATSNVGLILMDRGEFDRAEACLIESVERQRELGNERGMAIMFHNLGDNAQRRGDAESAERYLAQSTSLAHRLGDPRIEAYSTAVLAHVRIECGDLDRGRELLAAALASGRALDDKSGIAYVLWGHARLSVARGEWRTALELAGAAESLGNSTGVSLAAQQRAALDEMLAPARLALGDAVAARAIAFGRTLVLDDVLRTLDERNRAP